MTASIDLRSDTVTQPSAAMRAAMAAAEVGDDVHGEDPTVQALEALACELSGKAAAVFAPSGTQSNLIALLAHCGRGDEYIVGGDAHTYKYEGGGAAALGGIQPQPVDFAADGSLPLDAVEAAIKARGDAHFAKTALLALENTQHGRAIALEHHRAARALCDRHGLRLHLDGARAFNACTALGCTLAELAAPFDTVSLCLSKGLCAPVGSVLVGDAARIDAARRWRKVVGGGMRQAGVIAAAALIALRDMPARLAEDHRRACDLGEQLRNRPGLRLREDWLQTNMVWLELDHPAAEQLPARAAAQGVKLSMGRGGRPGQWTARLVVHADIDDTMIERAAAVIAGALA